MLHGHDSLCNACGLKFSRRKYVTLSVTLRQFLTLAHDTLRFRNQSAAAGESALDVKDKEERRGERASMSSAYNRPLPSTVLDTLPKTERKQPRPSGAHQIRTSSAATELLQEIQREREERAVVSGRHPPVSHPSPDSNAQSSGQAQFSRQPWPDFLRTSVSPESTTEESGGTRNGTALELFSGLQFMKPRSGARKHNRTNS